MLKTLVVIAGPTASGKTALGIELAKCFGTEIFSADSRQVYKELTIGTAKPSRTELKEVKHHFIDHISIHEEYSTGKYEKEALILLQNYFKKNDIAILVGGSGLYLDAVCKGQDTLPGSSPEIRSELETMLKQKGITFLQEKLKKLDRAYYTKIDLHNSRRLIRALEVCLVTGKPYSDLRTGEKKKRNFQIVEIGLMPEREILYQRINSRVEKMMEAGLLKEVEEFFPHKNLKALQTVGYSELFEYLSGQMELAAAVEKIKQHTRNYAKRQLTWFRKDQEIRWFTPGEYAAIQKHLQHHLNNGM